MSSYVTRKTPGDTAWFTHDRFGMFIHWGLYAMPARHEWVKMRERIPEAHYDIYFKHFNPDLYDAREWARLAKAAGMRYAVMTAKHHEGFCMFDSQYTDYKCTNTPAGRDLIREYVDAFRAEACASAFTIRSSTGTIPSFRSTCCIRGATTPMPGSRARAATFANTPNICATRCASC